MQKPLTNSLLKLFSGPAAIAAVMVSLVLGSCNLAIDDIQAPLWEPDILAPVARTTVDLTTLKDFSKISVRTDFTAEDLGLPIGEKPGATFTLDLGPYDFDGLEGLVDMTARETSIAFDLFNSLEADVAPGANIVVRSVETGEIVLLHPITEPLEAFGTIGDSAIYQNITFGGELELWVEDVVATARPNATIRPNDGIRLDLRIVFTDIEEARLEPDYEMIFSDTSELDISFEDIDADATGELRLHIDNGFPMGGEIDVFFLSKDGSTVVDHLTGQTETLPIPEISAEGRVTGMVGTQISIPVTPEKLDNIRDAGFFAFDASFFTPAEFGVLTTTMEDQMDVKLIADLKLSIQP